MKRISRDELFMEIAHTFAQRGTCVRAQVGVVIVAEATRIVAHGYNGSAPGQPHCLDVGCAGGIHGDEVIDGDESVGGEHNLVFPNGCTRTIHAEANAIAYAARMGASLKFTTMYSTHEPCLTCAKLIVAAGIVQVVYDEGYRDPGTPLLEACGVDVRSIS